MASAPSGSEESEGSGGVSAGPPQKRRRAVAPAASGLCVSWIADVPLRAARAPASGLSGSVEVTVGALGRKHGATATNASLATRSHLVGNFLSPHLYFFLVESFFSIFPFLKYCFALVFESLIIKMVLTP